MGDRSTSRSTGLGPDGEIRNVAAPEKVAAAYGPLLARVVADLRVEFGAALHSVYAYGSIAEGRARPGHSDADFIVVFTEPVADAAARLDAMTARILAEDRGLVSKIDTPHGTVAEILAPDQLHGWGAYLKILGLPLWGEDLRSRLPEFRPGPALTRAWNGDLRQQLDAARAKLATEDEAGRLRVQRGIAGTAVRSLFMLVAPDLGCWTTVFDEQADHVIGCFPDQADLLRDLAAARRAEAPLPDFAALLDRFRVECLPRFEASLGVTAEDHAPGAYPA